MSAKFTLLKASEVYPPPERMAVLKEGLILPPSLTLLPGEFVKALDQTDEEGVIVLTNFRVLVTPKNSPDTSKLTLTLPLGLIDSVEIRDLVYLCLSCKDARLFRVPFETTSDCEQWSKRIQVAVRPVEKVEQVFAFAHFAWRKEKLPPGSPSQATAESRDWFVQESRRLGFDNSEIWRTSSINKEFKFCHSYPEKIIVPSTISDELLEKVGNFRSSKRIPSVVWRNRLNGSVLARSSQPEVGWLGWRCNNDENLIEAIADGSALDAGSVSQESSVINGPEENGPNSGDMSLNDLTSEANKINGGKKLLIMDARSYTAAVGNRARGGGVECEDYYNKAEIVFMNLVNIHAIRKSFLNLRSLCGTAGIDSTSWFQGLDTTKWLSQIGSLLSAAIRCSNALEHEGRPVLVHCSDGWDRTPQITSLTQLMLDPYYRSIEGFQILVEKEWLDYGHKMADRCGNPFATSDPNERSPIFLQWLDCVHQLTLQFPTHFEFNQSYLIKLARHTYSNLFGNFLCNNLMERRKHRVHEQARSIWSFLLSDSQNNYINLLYCKHDDSLRPKTEPRDFLLWKEVFVSEQRVKGGIDSGPGTKPGSSCDSDSIPAHSSRDESEERPDSQSGKLSPSDQVSTDDNERSKEEHFGQEMSYLSQKLKSNGLTPKIQVKINGIESSTDTLVCEDDSSKNEVADSNAEQDTTVLDTKLPNGLSTNTSEIQNGHPTNESGSTMSDSEPRSSSSASTEASPGMAGYEPSSRPLSVNPATLFSSLQEGGLLIDDDGLEAHVDQVQDRMKEVLYQHNVTVETLQRKLQVTQSALQEVLNRKGAVVPGPMAEQMQALLELRGETDAPVDGCVLYTNGSTTSDGSWDNVDEKDTKPTLWMPDHTSDFCTKCQRHFWVADRKHHCRHCGLLFCHSCSSSKAPVPKENLLQPVRVCDDCFASLTKVVGPQELRGEEEADKNCDIKDDESDIEPACEATAELA